MMASLLWMMLEIRGEVDEISARLASLEQSVGGPGSSWMRDDLAHAGHCLHDEPSELGDTIAGFPTGNRGGGGDSGIGLHARRHALSTRGAPAFGQRG